MSIAAGLLEGRASADGPGCSAIGRSAGDTAVAEGRAVTHRGSDGDAERLSTYELFEYEERDLPISHQQARLLGDTKMVSVSLGRDPRTYNVKASHRVGTLVVEDVRILVKPKIRLENLFLLLEAGLGARRLAPGGVRLRRAPGPAARGDLVLGPHGRDHPGQRRLPPLLRAPRAADRHEGAP